MEGKNVNIFMGNPKIDGKAKSGVWGIETKEARRRCELKLHDYKWDGMQRG